MTDDAQTPDLIKGFLGWVAHNANYNGLWRFMNKSGASYSVDDFKQDLWSAWLETGDVNLTGDFIIDARSRGLFKVLNRIDYKYRRRQPISINAPIGDDKKGSFIDIVVVQPSPPSPIIIDEEEHSAVTRRRFVRQFASAKTQRDVDALDIQELAAPSDAARTPDSDSSSSEHVVICRRNWWRLMNL